MVISSSASEYRLHRTLEKLPAGAYTCDAQGLITYFNQRAVDFWGRAPKLNDPVDRFCGSFRLWSVSGEPIPHDQCWMALALRDGREYSGLEIVVERPDGKRWIALAHATPFHDDDGKLCGAVNVLVDITEHKRSEEALRDADRRKSEFLAVLAHELRNPLNPIRNAVDVMRLEGSADAELQWCRDVIDRQVDHLTRLIDDLLDISRISLNKLELRKEHVELATVLTSAVEMSRPVIDQQGQELICELPAEPIWLDVDAVRLSQVFMNLLNNAAKFTESGGTIRVSCRREGRDVVVSVKDTGIGIPPEKLLNLFDMFYQVDAGRPRSPTGLGIGLSLVQRLVEMHGGSVTGRSEGVGQGSEFLVRLPVLKHNVAATNTDNGAAHHGRPAGSHKVLVVDDNQDGAKSLAMVLDIVGQETRIAHDGLEAIEIAEQFRPDLVLLDIGMPKLNGYETAQRIRQQPWGRQMMLVALTGWGQEDDRRMSQGAGFDRHLVKPVDFDTLMALLAEVKTTTT